MPAAEPTRPTGGRCAACLKRVWAPLLALLLLFACQLATNAARFSRYPFPDQGFHRAGQTQLAYAMALSGVPGMDDRLAPAAGFATRRTLNPGPCDRLAILARILRNSRQQPDLYTTSTPITYVLASVPSLVLGLSAGAVLMGPSLVLALLLVVTLDAGRLLGGARVGAYAAIFTLLLPIVAWASHTAEPLIGNVTAAAVVLWALLRADAFRRPLPSLLAGCALALSVRWGENLGDGLKVASFLVGPVAVALLVALRRLVGGSWRTLAGLAGAAAAFALLFDRTWPLQHVGYILGAAEVRGRTWPEQAWTALEGAAAYGVALAGPPLGPIAAVAAVVAAARLLPAAAARWQVAFLLSSPAVGLLVLGASIKRFDYFAVAMVPSVALLLAWGLADRARVGPWPARVLAALLVPAWCALASVEWTPLVGLLETTRLLPPPPPRSATLSSPTGAVLSHAMPSFLPRGLGRQVRDETSAALAALAGLPAGRTVAIGGGFGLGPDELSFALQASRPDLEILQEHMGSYPPSAFGPPVASVAFRPPRGAAPRCAGALPREAATGSSWIVCFPAAAPTAGPR